MPNGKPIRHQLREDYPDIDFKWFCRIIELCGLDDLQTLRALLAEENEKARLVEVEKDRLIQRRFAEISASAFHRKLDIAVPAGIDGDHLRAIIVYGLAQVSGAKIFAGANYIPKQHVRNNVENKLDASFQAHLFQSALEFLIRNGVVSSPKMGGGGLITYALNVHEKAKGVTPAGREIIMAAKRFMHEHRPNHGRR